MSTVMIECDVVCRGCGYNLRSLAADGVCPECAVPVGFSLLPDSLSLNEPGDFRTARVGVLLVLALCAYDIAANLGWVLVSSQIAGRRVFLEFDNLIFRPLPQLVIFAAQAAALYLLSAVRRTRMRTTLLVLLLIYAFLLMRFSVGWAGRSSGVCAVNESIFDPVFHFLWLSTATRIARNLGRDGLTGTFAVLQWVLPLVLVLQDVVMFSDQTLFEPWGGIVIVLAIGLLNLVMMGTFLSLHFRLQWSMPAAGSDFFRPSPQPSPGVPGEGVRGMARAGILLETALLALLLVSHGALFGAGVVERVMSRFTGLVGGRLTYSPPIEIPSAVLAAVAMGQIMAAWWITSRQGGGRGAAYIVRATAVGAALFAVNGVFFHESRDSSAWSMILAQQLIYVMLFFVGLYFEADLAGRKISLGASAVKWVLVLPLGFETLRAMLFFGSGRFAGPIDFELYELLRIAQIVVQGWGIWVLFEVWRSFAPAAAK
jgi:hypothetical protein